VGASYFKIKKGTNLEPTAVSANQAGDLQAASALSNQLVYHDGSTTAVIATATNTLTLTNKTLTAPVITNANISATAGSLSNVDVDANTLSVTGNSDLANVNINDLAVSGDSTLQALTAQVTLLEELSVTGDSVLTGVTTSTIYVTGNALIDGTLAVTGVTSVGTLNLNNAVASGNISATGNGSFNGNGSFGGNLAVTGTSSVTGNASFQGTLSVEGEVSIDSPLNLEHQGSTPSNPAAGRNKVYYKTDGKLYQLNSAGSETLLGAGAYVTSGTRASPNNITAGGGITFGGQQRELVFIQGSGGHVNVTASPQITAGTAVGQELTLVGRNDSQTVTLENGDILELNGDISLGASDILSLVWDGSFWVEISRN